MAIERAKVRARKVKTKNNSHFFIGPSHHKAAERSIRSAVVNDSRSKGAP